MGILANLEKGILENWELIDSKKMLQEIHNTAILFHRQKLKAHWYELRLYLEQVNDTLIIEGENLIFSKTKS